MASTDQVHTLLGSLPLGRDTPHAEELPGSFQWWKLMPEGPKSLIQCHIEQRGNSVQSVYLETFPPSGDSLLLNP